MSNIFIDCSALFKARVVVFVLLIAFIIGKIYQTNYYVKLNLLPDDRSETSAIKDIKHSHPHRNVIDINLTIDTIFDFSAQNILNSLSLVARGNSISRLYLAKLTEHKIFPKLINVKFYIDIYGDNIEFQLYYYNNPIYTKFSYNISIDLFYPGLSLAHCDYINNTHYCKFSRACFTDNHFELFFNYATFSNEFIAVNGQCQVPPKLSPLYDKKEIQSKYELIENPSLVLFPTINEKSKWDSIYEIYSKAAKSILAKDVQSIYVYDPYEIFEEIYFLQNKIEVKRIHDNICFSQLNVNEFNDDLVSLKSIFTENGKEEKILILTNNNSTIENIDDILKIVSSKCNQCTIEKINIDNDENRLNASLMVRKAKFIIGIHNDIFLNAIFSDDSTFIDIVPKGFNDINWIENVKKYTNSKFLVLETNEIVPENCSENQSDDLCIKEIFNRNFTINISDIVN